MDTEWTIKPEPACVGCGVRHGSVNAELNCLRIIIRELRSALAWKKQQQC